MATIYSVTNFVGTKSWADVTAWQGGVVPSAADTIFIRGIRTTINQSTFPYWNNTRTIIVATTSGFPSSGTFYSVTDRNQKIKIDYTGLTSNSFTGCSVDGTYFPWSINNTPALNIYGGNIFNGAYVHFTPIISVDNITVNAGLVNIESGGYVKISNDGVYSFQDYTTVRDGTFHVSGSGEIKFGLNNTGTAGTASHLRGENFPMSVILMEGDENRLTTTLTSDVALGDGKLTVSNASNFEINDYIMVKYPDLNILRVDDGFRIQTTMPIITENGTYTSGSTDVGSPNSIMDECFNVVGKSGNDIYISRMNSIDVPILALTENSSSIVTDSTRLEVGEKVVINNSVYTITSIADHDHLLKDYDFTQAGTTLDDWTTDTDRSTYFANWAKSPSPLSGSSHALTQHVTTAYSHIFIKDIMRQEVKVEAWLSNYRGVTTGIEDGGNMGIVMHADPMMDFDRGFDSYARTYFDINRDSDYYRILQRVMSNDSNSSLNSAGISYNGLHKHTLECRGGLIKSYIDDQLVGESFMRSGGYFGRVGIHSNNHNSVTCLQYKVYAAAQLLTLDRDVTCSVGDKVYETGAEFIHKSGGIVVKQASAIEDSMGHSNLAYGYQGAPEYKGDYKFPYIWNASTNNINNYGRNTNSAFFNLINNQTVTDFNSYAFSTSNTTTTGSMIIDLDAQRAFTHVSFQEYFRVTGQFASPGGYFQIRTSSDRVTWNNVNIRLEEGNSFTPTVFDDRRRENGDSLRVYELETTQNARYVQFIRYGGNDTSTVENRWSSLGVRNYSQGYKMKLSNVSDLNVGDRVIPMYDGAFHNYLPESSYRAGALNNSIPLNKWTNKVRGYYEILTVDTVNKTITLDRPFTESFLNNTSRIIKLNKSIKITGEIGLNTWKRGRINLYSGSNGCRKYTFKNVEITGLGVQFPYDNSIEFSAWGMRNQDSYNPVIQEGLSFYGNFSSASNNSAHFWNASSYILRDSVLLHFNGRRFWGYFGANGSTYYLVGNTIGYGHGGDNSFQYSTANAMFNYNAVYGETVQVTLPRFFTIYPNGITTSPKILQYRRNYANGGPSHGVAGQMEGMTLTRLDFSDNMFEYMDDYIVQSLWASNQWPLKNVILPKRGNTDNRLTRDRSQGLIGTDRYCQSFEFGPYLTNYNNWGYDLTYNEYSYVLKYPTEDFFRVYRVDTTYQNATFGISLYITGEDTVVNIDYGFEYFHSLDQSVQRDNTNASKLTRFILRNDGRIVNDLALNKPTNMTPFTESITFDKPGGYIIGIGQAARNGFVGVKNIYSKITSNNPNNVRIMGNNFDAQQMAGPYPTKSYQVGNIGRTGAGTRINSGRLK
jgi:hypothetical protein